MINHIKNIKKMGKKGRIEKIKSIEEVKDLQEKKNFQVILKSREKISINKAEKERKNNRMLTYRNMPLIVKNLKTGKGKMLLM